MRKIEIGSGVDWAAFLSNGVFLIPFHSNADQLQPPHRLKQTLYQKLQVCPLISTLKPEFDNVAPERSRIEINNSA